MSQRERDLLESPEFHRMLARRWRVSLVLSALLFLLYYGYILLIAVNRQWLSRTLADGVTTVGIPVGIAVILGAWALTATYVVWANGYFDPEAERLRRRLRRH